MDPDAFVVMDSADSTAKSVQTAVRAGARGFMLKPYTMQRVRDVLDQYAVRRAARPPPA
jgi:two-component system chemotaxis response regulator CheY